MRKFAVPLCVAAAALAAGCTSSSGGSGVRVDAADTSSTATVPSLPTGTTGEPTGTTPTHSLGPDEPTSDPTPTPSTRPKPTRTVRPQPTPSTLPKPGPADVVKAYISAINRHDYRTAWTIYRHAAHGQSYSQFVAGFSDTDHDQLKVLGTSGSTVRVDLVAYQTDGSRNHYTGTYTVRSGRIYASHISAAS